MEEKTVVAAEVEQPDVGGLRASEEAINFLSSIHPVELQKCMFSDALVTMSEGDRELGEFIVTVEFTNRGQRPCLLLHAHSRGAIDEAPCGTTITAYLSMDLETLEQDQREYVKLQGHRLERRCHMVQRDGQMMVNKVTTVGEEVTRESVSHPLSALRGLVTEGSNLLLLRLFALRRDVPRDATFVSLNQESHDVTHVTYSELGLRQQEVGCKTVEVFGIQRVLDSAESTPATWHCYFLPDGHLASRIQVGSPITMRLLQLPPELEKDLMEDKPVFEKRALPWTEDMQMHSRFLDRKEELKADHAAYLRRHPELRALMADFLQFVLLRKPDDISQFAREYFTSCSLPESSVGLVMPVRRKQEVSGAA